jgi:hypothetical protein
MPALPPGVSAACWSAYGRITDGQPAEAATQSGVPIESSDESEVALGQLLP